MELRNCEETLMRPRDKIKTVKDFDKFLRSRGFSKRETRIICRAWHQIEKKGECGKMVETNGKTIGELTQEIRGNYWRPPG